MNWDGLVERLAKAQLPFEEEIYMEHYGKLLSAERPEFRDRNLRCVYGRLRIENIPVAVLVFPDEAHLHDYIEVAGEDPGMLAQDNTLLQFLEYAPAVMERVRVAISEA